MTAVGHLIDIALLFGRAAHYSRDTKEVHVEGIFTHDQFYRLDRMVPDGYRAYWQYFRDGQPCDYSTPGAVMGAVIVAEDRR